MSNYRIASCPNIDSSHVCTKGCGGHTGSSFQSVISLGSSSMVDSLPPLSQSFAVPSFASLHIPSMYRYQPQEVDMPYSTYPLNWGYNRDYYLSNDVKFLYKMRQSCQQYARPYSNGEYNVSRYHVQYPSHMYHPILNDYYYW